MWLRPLRRNCGRTKSKLLNYSYLAFKPKLVFCNERLGFDERYIVHKEKALLVLNTLDMIVP